MNTRDVLSRKIVIHDMCHKSACLLYLSYNISAHDTCFYILHTYCSQKFGTQLIARDLGIKGGYKPGSNVSRNLIAYSNIYWAKRLAGAMKKPVGVLTAEQINLDDIKSLGDISRTGKIFQDKAKKEGRPNESIIAINPGGEETWAKLVSAHGQPNCPVVVMNNSYSTSYDLGNRKGFEEVYYLKRISKGFVYRVSTSSLSFHVHLAVHKLTLIASLM